MSFLERAQPLIDRGFSVIPLEPKEKKPVAGMGVTKKSSHNDQIAEWAEKYPDSNVAVCACETFLILDADDAAAVEAITGKLNTYTVQSSPGKAHYYFRHDPEWFQKAGNLELGKMGSLRANNQYVVGAGSIHPKTLLPYQVINHAPVAILRADVYEKLKEAAACAERDLRKVVADWDEKSAIPEGMRQTILKHLAATWHDGIATEEELFARLMAVNDHCIPPKPPSEISRLVQWVLGKDPNRPPVKLILNGPVLKRQGYVLNPIGKYDGWFPLGQVSQLYGASGAGKSTLSLQILEQVALGGEFLRHKVAARSVLVVSVDRNEEDFQQTLERLGIPRSLFPFERLTDEGELDAKVAAYEVNELIKKHGQPEVVLFEAMDAPAGDETKKCVHPYMKKFQKIATHHGTAIIGTWGSPKRMSTKEHYKSLRDAASGSSWLGRLSASMLYVREDSEGVRHVEIGHRQCAPEKFVMKFHEDGRLHDYVATDVPEVVPLDPLDTVVREHTWAELQNTKLMSKASYYRRRVKLGLGLESHSE